MDQIQQNVLDNSTSNISVNLLDLSSSDFAEQIGQPIAKKRKVVPNKSRACEFKWDVCDGREGMIPMFPESNYEDCRGIKPHTLFEKIFDDEIFHLIIDQSTKYAQFRYQANSSITIAELKTFIGILLSGYNYHTSMRMWSNDEDLRNHLVCGSMRKTRFMEILKYLHFADNDTPRATENQNSDKMWKLRPHIVPQRTQ